MSAAKDYNNLKRQMQ